MNREMFRFLFLILLKPSHEAEFHETKYEFCEFQEDYCNYKVNSTLWQFSRETARHLEESGISGPTVDHLNETSNFFLFLNLDELESNKTEKYSFIESQFLEGGSTNCFRVWYFIQDLESSVDDMYISMENEQEIPTELWRFKANTEGWSVGQIFIPDVPGMFKLRVVVLRSKPGKGFVALDDFVLEAGVADNTCKTVPAGAEISATTPPTSSRFPDCDFTTDLCGWMTDESEFYWTRANSEELAGSEHDAPSEDYQHTTNGYFLFVTGDKGVSGQNAVFMSPVMEAPTTYCVTFYFNIFFTGSITNLQLKIVGDELEEVVWDIQDSSLYANDEWHVGQIQVNAMQIHFIATHGEGTKGYVALDQIFNLEGEEVCSTIPEEAAAKTTTTTTTKPESNFPDCNFDENECGWITSTDDQDKLWWKRGNSEEFDSEGVANPGKGDENENTKGYYMLADPSRIGELAILSSPLIETDQSSCMVFWFSLFKNGSFEALRVKHLDSDIELTVWELSDFSYFADNEWMIGQVPVRNKRILFEAVKAGGNNGWAAIDDIHSIERPDCQTIPPEASPSTSTTSSPTTTSSAAENIGCNFEEGFCSWKSGQDDGGNDWWSRGSGEEFGMQSVEAPRADFANSSTGHFVLATFHSSGTLGRLTSPPIETNNKSCIIFWFNIVRDGAFSNLRILTASLEGEELLVWSQDSQSLNANQEWNLGQVEVFTHSMVFEVIKGGIEFGWVALDEIMTVEEYNGECPNIPEDSATPTNSPTTSTSGTGFPSCNFNSDLCGWKSSPDDDLKDWWVKGNSEDFTANGVSNPGKGDEYDDKTGYYVLAESVRSGTFGILASPRIESEEKSCMSFWFNLFGNGSFEAIRIKTVEKEMSDEREVTVWELLDSSVFVDEWLIGQVEVYDRQVVFEAVKGSGDIGWAALDDIHTQTVEDCTVIPGNAAITTPAPQTTPHHGIDLPECTFELNECGWTMDPDMNATEAFQFIRIQGNDLSESLGPTGDHTGKTETFFMWANAGQGQPNTVTGLQSPEMQAGKVYCLAFWFDTKPHSGIKSMEIYTVSMTGENKNLAWQFSTKLDFWEEGRVPVAHTHPQNYKVVVEVVRGEESVGYVALDDFTVSQETDCETKPSEAAPSTAAPETTTPALNFPGCNFDNDMCGWKNEERPWKWKRVSAGEADPGPSEGQGSFMWAAPESAAADTFAVLESVKLNRLVDTCLSFDFSIVHNESISEFRILAAGEENIFEYVWVLSGFTHDSNAKWEKGQVKIKASKVTVEVEKKGNNGYAAIDNIYFEDVDLENCHTLPDFAAVTTAAPPTPGPSFTGCNFEDGLCNWSIVDNAYTWRRTDLDTLVNNEKPRPANSEGMFLYAPGRTFVDGEKGVFLSMAVNPGVKTCMTFRFSIMHDNGIKSLRVGVIAGGEYNEYEWELLGFSHDSNQLWDIGQLSIEATQVYFEIEGGLQEDGYAAIDNILFEERSECPTLPVFAQTTTTAAPATTSDSQPGFPDCDFEIDTCSWADESTGDTKWQRVNDTVVTNSGDTVPGGNIPGFYAYSSGRTGNDDETHLLSTPMLDKSTYSCMNFYFNIYHDGSMKALRVITTSHEGYRDFVWEMSSKFESVNGQWQIARVPVDAPQISFESVKGDGTVGYVGVDDVMFDRSLEEHLCTIHPEEAVPNPTDVPPTDPPVHNYPDCDFQEGLCNWNIDAELNTTDAFLFRRSKGSEQAEATGPIEDHDHNKEGYFLWATTKHGNEGDYTVVVSPPITQSKASCLHFYIWIQSNDNDVGEMRVDFEDSDLEVTNLWLYPGGEVIDYWEKSSAPIPPGENFKITVSVKKSKNNQGYASVDDFLFDVAECEVLPVWANPPPPTTPPTPSTQPPSTETPPTIECDFEVDFCDCNVESATDFKFTREKGEFFNDIVDGPATDNMGNKQHYFAYVSAKNSQSTEEVAVMEIPLIYGANHEVECFKFWFSIKHNGGFKSLSVVQEDEELEGEHGIIELLWSFTDTGVPDDGWLQGEVPVRAHSVAEVVQNYTLRFVAESGLTKEGWAAVDDFQLIRTDGCVVKPPNAIPSTTPFQPSTTPSPNEVYCDFQENLCNYEITGEGEFKLHRVIGADISDKIESDHYHNAGGYFLFAESTGEKSGVTMVVSPFLEGDKHPLECFSFWFYVDGFFDGAKNESLLVMQEDQTDPPSSSMPWLYTKPTSEWTKGQVELRATETEGNYKNYRFIIMAAIESGSVGFLGIDDLEFSPNDICHTLPPEEPTTTEATTHFPPTIECDFEDNFCGYEVTGQDTFKFTTQKGDAFGDIVNGPMTDNTGSREHYFAYISAKDSDGPGDISVIETPMILGANHEVECFNFWFSIKHNGGLQSISVVQQDEELEGTHGIIELLWEYTDIEVEGDSWMLGEVPVRAHVVADIVQNYTLRWVAESGRSNIGWAAVDDFSLVRTDGCQVKPPNSVPSTTPFQPSTTPSPAEVFCDFQENDCNYTIFGEGDFKFHRVKGADIPEEIEADHYGNAEGKFLFANSKGPADVQETFTSVESQLFVGADHAIECFNFWFNVDGFLNGDKNESIMIILKQGERQSNDSVVWVHTKPTPSWTFGQIELRAAEHEGTYESWRFMVLAIKASDSVGFIAVDDFAFRPSDICEILPPEDGTSTTSRPETTSSGDCDFKCGDGKCITARQKCDFVTDCGDSSDEMGCPREINFDACDINQGGPMCGFEESPVDNLDWVVVTEADTANTTYPVIDRGGKFLWIEQKSSEVADSDMARVHSARYQNSASTCTVRFWYQILGEGGRNAFITPAIHIIEEDRDMTLDYLTTNDKWDSREIQIGRRIGNFELVFSREQVASYDAGTSVDDVYFVDCGLPQPQEDCPEYTPYHCDNKVCVELERLCDLTDDCGDLTDEIGQYCVDNVFLQNTFEMDDQPLGVFTTGPEDRFHWQRGTGMTENSRTGPPFDHTMYNDHGHYLYIDSSYSGEDTLAELVSTKFKQSPDQPCGVVFYYHMFGPAVGTLQAFMRYGDGKEIKLYERSGDDGNIWKREQITLVNSTSLGPFQLVFKASIGAMYSGDIALDDIVFCPHCRPDDNPSTSTPSPCGPLEHTCGNGECILPTQVCDFHYDCSDSSDEAACPALTTFENCDTVEDCHWQITQPSSINWVISSGTVATDPAVDHVGNATSHFMFVEAENNSSGVAEVETHLYQNSYTGCSFNFWLYMAKHSANIVLFPFFRHMEDNTVSELDKLDFNSIADSLWTNVQIGIGRHPLLFSLFFRLVYEGEVYDASVAVDDVDFFNCGHLPQQESCAESEYHCEVTKACVSKSQLCDFSDDCGLYEDEGNCEGYTRTNFDDPTQPFGFFQQEVQDADFKWSRGNGSTVNPGTGPPFDHTLFEASGSYLYIESEKQETGKRAFLSTPFLNATKEGCMIRFFYHMHGLHVGFLTLYHQDQLGKLTQLWETGNSSADLNTWQRYQHSLTSDTEFRVVLSASVGGVGESDIAIDDVSMSPECRFLDFGSTSHKPETTKTSPGTQTTRPTTEKTTSTRPQTTTKRHETTTTTVEDEVATVGPYDEKKHLVIIVSAVLGTCLVVLIVGVSVLTLRSRWRFIPGMERLYGIINPNYSRMDDSMVSLRDLTNNRQT